MLKFLSIILLTLSCLKAQSQNQYQLNGIVFIDGKLASGEGMFVFPKPNDTISFIYTYGDIIVDSLYYDNLIKRLKNNDSIEVVIQNPKRIYGELKEYRHSFKQPISFLGPYFVIRITNLKKGKYLFGITTTYFMDTIDSREYNMFEEWYKEK